MKGDVDDENWHEDTYAWRQKDRKKHVQPFDPNNPDAFVAQSFGASGMQMVFVTLYSTTHKNKKETEDLALRWATILRTDGLVLQVYTLNTNSILFTQEDGRVIEAREFYLSQPETEKVRWKDKDWLPEDSHKLKRNQIRLERKNQRKRKKAAQKRAAQKKEELKARKKRKRVEL